jgi:hypothetical protein
MPRWLKGQDTIHALLERGHLQQVAADSETAETLVTTSERHVQSAATLADTTLRRRSASHTTPPAKRPPPCSRVKDSARQLRAAIWSSWTRSTHSSPASPA